MDRKEKKSSIFCHRSIPSSIDVLVYEKIFYLTSTIIQLKQNSSQIWKRNCMDMNMKRAFSFTSMKKVLSITMRERGREKGTITILQGEKCDE